MPLRRALLRSLGQAGRVAGREALAFARQATLLHRDLDPVLPKTFGPDLVVFVHGLFATAGVLKPFRKAIERELRWPTASFTYPPTSGLDRLVGRVEALLEQVPDHTRIHLVGHSLGGIVVRAYALEIDDLRVAQTISLASPFAGVGPRATGIATVLSDLQPGSARLASLRFPESAMGRQRHEAVPHLSVIAGADSIVSPPLAHALPGADVRVVERCGHNALLYDTAAVQAVLDRLAAKRVSPAADTW